MTTHTDLAAQARERIKKSLALAEKSPKINRAVVLGNVLNDHLETVLAALESTERLAGGGEPVAFIQRQRSSTDNDIDEELVWHKDEELEGVLYEYQPLYTTPPPQAERVPQDSELLDWLSTERGSNLISDDGGKWALSTTGMQPVPPKGGFNEPVNIVSIVFPEEWHDSPRGAIRAAIGTPKEST